MFIRGALRRGPKCRDGSQVLRGNRYNSLKNPTRIYLLLLYYEANFLCFFTSEAADVPTSVLLDVAASSFSSKYLVGATNSVGLFGRLDRWVSGGCWEGVANLLRRSRLLPQRPILERKIAYLS